MKKTSSMKSIQENHSTVFLTNSPEFYSLKNQLMIFQPKIKEKKIFMMVTTHTMNQIIVYCFITLVVYADEIVRSDQKQGRVTFSSDFEFDDFDTQEKQNYEDEDFISQEFEQVKRDTKVIIEELEQLVVTVEGESNLNDSYKISFHRTIFVSKVKPWMRNA